MKDIEIHYVTSMPDYNGMNYAVSCNFLDYFVSGYERVAETFILAGYAYEHHHSMTIEKQFGTISVAKEIFSNSRQLTSKENDILYKTFLQSLSKEPKRKNRIAK